MAIKSVVSKLETSPQRWNTGGRPSKRDIVKNPPRQIDKLGECYFTEHRSAKVSIKGGQK